MQTLLDQFSHLGPCSYWFLVEMCAEKLGEELLRARRDRPIQATECVFRFHKRILCQSLRVSPTTLRRFLDACQTLSLLSANWTGNTIEISMPKLLEILDRDAKRPRRVRGQSAPKRKKEEKEKEEEKEGAGENVEPALRDFCDPEVQAADIPPVADGSSLNDVLQAVLKRRAKGEASTRDSPPPRDEEGEP